MPGPPRVQLSLKGRLLSEVPFADAALRIGRMRENDIVVNNLAVSRFHATLRREGESYVLEDLGSENGTQVNGARISGSVSIGPSDIIQLGKYELRIVTQAGMQIAGAPTKKSSDVWDASQTYMALGDAPPKLPTLAPASPPDPQPAFDFSANEIAAAEVAPEENATPDPEGVFAFGEDDLGGPEASESRLGPQDLATDPLTPPSPEHTALFDFGSDAAIKGRARAPFAAPSLETTRAGRLHAGLIVQREGKLHELRPWDGEELCAGRAPECELVLSDAGISRRHATFKRTGEAYEVSDLGSVNGIYVNGVRSKQHVLAVGDVVRIESFELTFVLDHQPIGSEISGPSPAQTPMTQDGGQTRFSLEASAADEQPLEIAPLAGDPGTPPELSPTSANLGAAPEPAFDVLPTAADPEAAALPEIDLVADGTEEPEEKELVADAEFVAASVQTGSRSLPRSATRGGAAFVLEIALDASQLPAPLRKALALLGEERVRIPALVSVVLGKPAK